VTDVDESAKAVDDKAVIVIAGTKLFVDPILHQYYIFRRTTRVAV